MSEKGDEHRDDPHWREVHERIKRAGREQQQRLEELRKLREKIGNVEPAKGWPGYD